MRRHISPPVGVRILSGVDDLLFNGGNLGAALEAQAARMREAVDAEPEER